MTTVTLYDGTQYNVSSLIVDKDQLQIIFSDITDYNEFRQTLTARNLSEITHQINETTSQVYEHYFEIIQPIEITETKDYINVKVVVRKGNIIDLQMAESMEMIKELSLLVQKQSVDVTNLQIMLMEIMFSPANNQNNYENDETEELYNI